MYSNEIYKNIFLFHYLLSAVSVRINTFRTHWKKQLSFSATSRVEQRWRLVIAVGDFDMERKHVQPTENIAGVITKCKLYCREKYFILSTILTVAEDRWPSVFTRNISFSPLKPLFRFIRLWQYIDTTVNGQFRLAFSEKMTWAHNESHRVCKQKRTFKTRIFFNGFGNAKSFVLFITNASKMQRGLISRRST